MNSINTRLTKILSGIRSSNASDAAIQQVVDGINSLNFGGVSSEGLAVYFQSLDNSDQMEFIRLGGNQFHSELSGANLYRNQQAIFMLEFIRQRDLEPEEINGQMYSAFQVGIMEIFGQDWESRLNKPTGSSSVAVGFAKESRTKTVVDADGNTKEVTRKVRVNHQYKQVGSPILSLRPIEIGKHPTATIENSMGAEIEIQVHQPTENSIECGIMVKDIYWALATKSAKSKMSGDITSTGTRQVFIVGLVPHEKMRKCGEVGHIKIGDNVFSLTDHSKTLLAINAYCDEESDFTLLNTAFRADPLVWYYQNKFPGLDAWKLACNARAGVSRDRLTKGGMAPKKYLPVVGDTYGDIGIRAAQTKRYLDNQVEQVVRRLLELTKLKSAENLVKQNSVSEASYQDSIDALLRQNPGWSVEDAIRELVRLRMENMPDDEDIDVYDWYDEIYDVKREMTYEECAMELLHKRWINQNRAYMKTIGTVWKDSDGLHVTPKNIGKVGRSKDTKRRTGDKSMTVNGVRCQTLTTSFMVVSYGDFEANLNSEELTNLLSGIGFDFAGLLAEERADAEMFYNLDGELEREGGFNWSGAELGRDLSREDLVRLVDQCMRKASNRSIDFLLSSGDPWLSFRPHLMPEGVEVVMRHVDVDELKELQLAREWVLLAGEELNSRNILDALRKPGKWMWKVRKLLGIRKIPELRLVELDALLHNKVPDWENSESEAVIGHTVSEELYQRMKALSAEVENRKVSDDRMAAVKAMLRDAAA